MNREAKNLIEQARELSPAVRIEIIDGLLATLDEPDETMDRLWAQEAEDRLAAYRRGEIKAVHLNEVLAKYRTS
jgi:hypothetical protein